MCKVSDFFTSTRLLWLFFHLSYNIGCELFAFKVHIIRYPIITHVIYWYTYLINGVQMCARIIEEYKK